jgi:hypothetical protein
MQTFPLVFEFHGRRFHLIVEEQKSDKPDLELYKIYPKENPVKFLLVSSNRPVLLRYRLRHKAINWQIKEGQLNNQKAFERMIEALTEELRKPLK